MKALWKHEGGNLVYQVAESAEGEKELRARGFMTLDELNDPLGLLERRNSELVSAIVTPYNKPKRSQRIDLVPQKP